MPTRRGSFRLFKLAGITVYIHWAWFLAFVYLASRSQQYSNYGWNALEILALFAIVLTHEFGHQLACRSVGGQTHDIILWPLGGVAYVNPPQRPGAAALEHRRRPAGERGADSRAVCPGVFGFAVWLERHAFRRLQFHQQRLGHQPRAAHLQPDASLSTRRRANFAFAAVVCLRPGQQFDGGERHRLYRRGGVYRTGDLRAVSLAGHHGGIHPDELLGRLEAGADAGPHREDSPPRGFRVSIL